MNHAGKKPSYTENLFKQLEEKRVEYREKLLRDRGDNFYLDLQISPQSEPSVSRLGSSRVANKRKQASEAGSGPPTPKSFSRDDHAAGQERRRPPSPSQEVVDDEQLQLQNSKIPKAKKKKVASRSGSISIDQSIPLIQEQNELYKVASAFSQSVSLSSQNVPSTSQDEEWSQCSTGLFVSERNPAAREERRPPNPQSQPVKQEPMSQYHVLVESDEIEDSITVRPSSTETDHSANQTTNQTVFGPTKRPARKVKAVYKENKAVDTRVLGKTEWYTNIKPDKKFSRSDVISMQRITTLIQNCMKAAEVGEEFSEQIAQVRTQLQRMEFFSFITPTIIKQSRVLDQNGLPAIFDNEDVFPWDIVADAEALYTRWMSGDIDPHLLRGINTSKGVLESGQKRTSHRINTEEKARYGKSANVVGSNGLTMGQWWPNRLCAVRDGAHGEQEAGIHGKHGQGAFSIVVANSDYVDNDNGEDLTYCGTASSTSSPTRSTQFMRETLSKTKNPVRVLRAANKKNKYAPESGLRYDGLYTIVDEELLDEDTAMYRFKLIRQPDQHPIRYQGDEVRPSNAEKKELMKIRHLLKGWN